jgi:hypothetical protein
MLACMRRVRRGHKSVERSLMACLFDVAGERCGLGGNRAKRAIIACVWLRPRTEKSDARTEFAAFCSLLLNLSFATDAVISTSTDIDNRYVCYSISCSSPSTPQQPPSFPLAASPTRLLLRTARARHTTNQTLSRAPSTNTSRLQQSWVKESQEV